ncbi:glycosyltransferase, partial [Campylobacter coli]|nr:glycosyltransferase [Campylobacter coli]
SQELSDLNRDNLSSLYGIPKHKFDYINNIISDDDILFKSNFRLECQSDERLYEKDYKIFITIGRLSPEKNHIGLIQAFCKFHQNYSKTRLIILGDGPLKEELQEYIRKNDLGDCIFMLGIKSNPYPYLKKADCFVLSSLHEGQPIVLLESLVLSKPIVATNILGNKSVLKNFGGILVEKDIEDIVSGLNSFMEGHADVIEFDSKKYNKETLNKFNRLFKIKTTVVLKEKNKVNAPCIIMAKPDGFGMRLFSLMAGMIIAEKIGFSFYFKWVDIEDVIGNIEEMFSSKNHIPFALGKVEEIFDEKFIHKYYIENQEIKSNHGFGMHQKCKNFDDIQNGYYEQPWGWYSPGIGGGALSQWISDYEEEQCYKDFRQVYKKIQFSEKYLNIIEDAKSIAKNLGHFVSIHIRGADIVFSSSYKQASLYGFVGDKYFPYEIAIEIIKSELNKNNTIIVFSQDVKSSEKLIDYFKNSKIILADVFAKKYTDTTQRAFFEINLMSHSELIYTPGISLQKSAFSQCASFISGNKKDVSFHEVFSLNEQFEILNRNIQILDLNPLYRSMAYFRLYQLSLSLKKNLKYAFEYIEKAIENDNDNMAWKIHKC